MAGYFNPYIAYYGSYGVNEWSYYGLSGGLFGGLYGEYLYGSSAIYEISVDRITIINNKIFQCVQNQLADTSNEMLAYMGYGGIALADVTDCVIQNNIIVDNGTNHGDPVSAVFIFYMGKVLTYNFGHLQIINMGNCSNIYQ